MLTRAAAQSDAIKICCSVFIVIFLNGFCVVISRHAQHDKTGEYPTDIIKKAWELGLVRLPLRP